MNNDTLKQTFDTITPTPEQKDRMLSQILGQIDAQVAQPATPEAPVISLAPKRKSTHARQWLGLAASIAVVIGIGVSLQQPPTPTQPQGNPSLEAPIDTQASLSLGTFFEKKRIYEDVNQLKVTSSTDFEIIHTLEASEARTLLTALDPSLPLQEDQIDFKALQDAPFVILGIVLSDGNEFQIFYTPSLGLLDLNSIYYNVSPAAALALEPLLK
ncbi:MAG: hypothetical protein ACRCW2_14170 [Cellulosilyticaceae bacterium]